MRDQDQAMYAVMSGGYVLVSVGGQGGMGRCAILEVRDQTGRYSYVVSVIQ